MIKEHNTTDSVLLTDKGNIAPYGVSHFKYIDLAKK